MAIIQPYEKSGTANADSVNLATFSGQPKSGNIYTYIFHGLGGVDTFYVGGANSQTASYANRFSSSKFTIGGTALGTTLMVPNGTGTYAGMYVISGASNSGTSFTFVLDSVEKLVFSDKIVTLSYDTTPPALTQTGSAIPLAVTSN
ncbi:MAG: hypothetical protein WCK32_08995, partial [Chlorobiaceae bacterium]